MTELLTAAQMRAIEHAAIESGEVTGLELMERAGRGVVEAIFEEWPDLKATSHRAVVLCGPGNNGGDGFVVARLLKEWGWEVEVYLYGDPEKLPPDAKVNYERWGALGETTPWDPESVGTAKADIYVDAVFGAGLTRAPADDIMEPLTALYTSGLTLDRLVAIDSPTGLCMDSGMPLSQEFGAAYSFLTVTFHQARVGHYIDMGPNYCGSIRTKPIGLVPVLSEGLIQLRGEVCIFDLSRLNDANKFDHGHALILSGPPGHTGAARLAARAALRIGSGLVTLGVPPEAQVEVASQITAIMMQEIGEVRALESLLQDDRINALCIGPGFGVERAREWVPVVCGGVKPRSTVLDADALTAFADDPDLLFAMLHENCVLTPHAGEFARLFPDIAEKLSATPTKGPGYSKVDATREAAARAGCTVLFKGPDTVIAAPDGRCSINSAHYDRAAPWLATAGSGDVLAGFITGLLARGFPPMQAAETAVYLHVECALSFGAGLIAEDIPEELPKVFRALGVT